MRSADTLAIDNLRADEIEAAVELWRAAGLTRPWNDARADIRLALDGPSSTVLAGRRDGRLAATAMVGADGHRGWVYYLAVAEGHRGRGFGAAMMRACEDWAAARGVAKMNLMVRTENAAIRGFYAALGYVPSDVQVLARRLPGRDRRPPRPTSGGRR